MCHPGRYHALNLTGTCKASRIHKVVSIALRTAQGRITRPHDAVRSLAQNPAAKCTADILCFRVVLPVGTASGRDLDQLQLALKRVCRDVLQANIRIRGTLEPER